MRHSTKWAQKYDYGVNHVVQPCGKFLTPKLRTLHSLKSQSSKSHESEVNLSSPTEKEPDPVVHSCHYKTFQR